MSAVIQQEFAQQGLAQGGRRRRAAGTTRPQGPRSRADRPGPALGAPCRNGVPAPRLARPMRLAEALDLGAGEAAVRVAAAPARGAAGGYRLTDRGITVVVAGLAALLVLATVVVIGQFLAVTAAPVAGTGPAVVSGR